MLYSIIGGGFMIYYVYKNLDELDKDIKSCFNFFVDNPKCELNQFYQYCYNYLGFKSLNLNDDLMIRILYYSNCYGSSRGGAFKLYRFNVLSVYYWNVRAGSFYDLKEDDFSNNA